MALALQVNGDAVVSGQLKAGTFLSPASSVNNAAVEANAKVEYSKIEHLHAIPYRQQRRNVVHHISTPIQNIDNGAGTTYDRAVHYFTKAGRIISARIVYDVETAGTVAGANAKLGVTVGGAEVVAATAYTNSATVGSITAMTLVDPVIDAGETLHWRHTGIAATAAGEAHLEIEYVEANATVYGAEEQIHIVYGVDGDVESVEVSCLTAPTSSSSFTVDVQKWNTSTWASVLSAAITVDSATMTSNNQVLSDIPTNGALLDGYKLKVVIAATGAESTQGQDLVVTVRVSEKALTT